MKNKICFNQLSNDELKAIAEDISLELKNRMVNGASAEIILTELRKILSNIKPGYSLSLSVNENMTIIDPTDDIAIGIVDEEYNELILATED